MIGRQGRQPAPTPPEERLALGALQHFGSTSVGLVAGVVLSIAVARSLGPTEMGSYALALMIVTALEAVTGLGLARVALKFAAELRGQAEGQQAMWWLLTRRAAAGAAGAGLLLAAAPGLGYFFRDPQLPPLLVVGAGLLVCNLLANVLESALEGVSRFDLLAATSIGLTPLHVVATAGALVLGTGALGVMAAQVVAGLATLGVLLVLSRRAGAVAWSRSPPERALRARLARFARGAYLLSLLSFVVHDRVEVLILGALATGAQVGLYSVALSAADATMRLGPLVVATVYFPLMAAAWTSGKGEQAATYYARCLRYLLLTAAPLAATGIALAEPGVTVVFGADYLPMVPVLRLALLATAVAACAQGPEAVLTAAERQGWLLSVRVVLVVVNLILDLILVPRFAAIGAAWAIVSVAVAEALALGWLVSWLGIPPVLPGLGRIVIAASLAGVTAAALGTRTDGLGLALGLAGSCVVYGGCLMLTRFFDPQDLELLTPLSRRASGWLRGRSASTTP